jgi:peptidase M28-like protein
MKRTKLLWFLALAAGLALIACDRDKESAAPASNSSVAASAPEKVPLKFPPDDGTVPTFDGDRAMQYLKDIVKFGPRPLGSASHKKVEDYIASHLKGDQVEDDVFTAETNIGKFPVHNIVAKFPGQKDGIIVLASHYDTNYPLRNTPFVGANDGASSSALLLEIANQLRGKPNDGYSVWLVWDDAEEAMKPDTEAEFMSDSLYGITHLAEKWEADGTLKKIKAFLLADMIADSDLNVDRDSNSTPWLEDTVYEAATRLGYQSHFFSRTVGMEDDHLPFVKRGVACADLIDFSYGYNLAYWHTTEDTVDKLSPRSLQIVGSVMLKTIHILNKMDPLPETKAPTVKGAK